jgi:hypothetical protein
MIQKESATIQKENGVSSFQLPGNLRLRKPLSPLTFRFCTARAADRPKTVLLPHQCPLGGEPRQENDRR